MSVQLITPQWSQRWQASFVMVNARICNFACLPMHGTLMLLHQTGIYLDEIWFPAFDICSTHWEDAQDVMMVSSSSQLEYERSIMRRERERERARRLIQKDLLIVVFLLDLEIYPRALYHVSSQSWTAVEMLFM